MVKDKLLFIVRHGESEQNALEMLRTSDDDLTKKGEK